MANNKVHTPHQPKCISAHYIYNILCMQRYTPCARRSVSHSHNVKARLINQRGNDLQLAVNIDGVDTKQGVTFSADKPQRISPLTALE
jgi:hypothetical protein